jgi:hypothetical protein
MSFNTLTHQVSSSSYSFNLCNLNPSFLLFSTLTHIIFRLASCMICTAIVNRLPCVCVCVCFSSYTDCTTKEGIGISAGTPAAVSGPPCLCPYTSRVPGILSVHSKFSPWFLNKRFIYEPLDIHPFIHPGGFYQTLLQQWHWLRCLTACSFANELQVGYTNAGKSTLLNRLSGAGLLAEDRLFATLDPTTRRVEVFSQRMP